MALTDSDGNGMVMPIAPMNNGGFGVGGDGGWWILLLFILLAGGNGWGNGFGDGGLYPWMNQAELTTGGFQNQLMNDNVSAIRDGVQNLSTQLCNGFANAETAATSRQMANMNQAFAAQTAMTQGFNQIGSQFADCCCENRLGIADLKYTVATENCADRAALSDGIREIIASNTASTQRILDQLCQDKIEAKNDTIAQLRQELIFARGQASQDVQTAAIEAGQRALANEVEQYVAPMPRPAYIVQNPNCCTNTCNCGM